MHCYHRYWWVDRLTDESTCEHVYVRGCLWATGWIEFKGQQPQVLALHTHLVWGKVFLIVSICASHSRILAGALLGDSPATTFPHWTQLYRFWGFELRTSNFPNKHFYPLRYHPGPTSVILTNLFLFYNAGDRTQGLKKWQASTLSLNYVCD